MPHLAVNGGKQLFPEYLPPQVGQEDATEWGDAINEVLRRNILSGFRGNWIPSFWGGRAVQDFEKLVEEEFGAPYAYAVNSATSGLWCACAAAGLRPGDEVIVTPWSMSCSATVPLLFGAIPVFADIDPKTFCLDPADVERKITSRTKAIIVVDLFGNVYDPEIDRIARAHGLIVIEDAAQAIGAVLRDGKKAGTCGDFGVFSFTQGKHLTAGEGGVILAKDERLALRASLARNHAEAVTNAMPSHLAQPDMVGLNLRMTEIQAAILIEQLKDGADSARVYGEQTRIDGACAFFNEYRDHDFLRPAYDEDQISRSSFYVLPLKWTHPTIHRDKFCAAVRAELNPQADRIDRGVPFGAGYITPLYLMPVFQKKLHWAFSPETREYPKGICPVAEDAHENWFITTLIHGLGTRGVQDYLIPACNKVLANLEELE